MPTRHFVATSPDGELARGAELPHDLAEQVVGISGDSLPTTALN